MKKQQKPEGPLVPNAPGWWWMFDAGKWRPVEVYQLNGKGRLLCRTWYIYQRKYITWGGRCQEPQLPKGDA